HTRLSGFSRRSILTGAGALVVSIGMPVGPDTLLAVRSAAAQGAKPPLVPSELDSYIAINADGSVSAFFGKMHITHTLFTPLSAIWWRQGARCGSPASRSSWGTPRPA